MILGIILTLIFLYFLYKLFRYKIRRDLQKKRTAIVASHPVYFYYIPPSEVEEISKSFKENNVVEVVDFVDIKYLQALQSEAISNICLMKGSYVPLHKQGHTLSYEQIQKYAPNCLGFYHSKEVVDLVSEIVGEKVYQTPDTDQSSLSILCYKDAGDYINWHFDHNFYKGRHFTVLLALVNENESQSGLSSSDLLCKVNNKESVFKMQENTLVIFEGAKVLHKATPVVEGDLRILLSMTFCANPKINVISEFFRRVKDIAFFGLRSLVD